MLNNNKFLYYQHTIKKQRRNERMSTTSTSSWCWCIHIARCFAFQLTQHRLTNRRQAEKFNWKREKTLQWRKSAITPMACRLKYWFSVGNMAAIWKHMEFIGPNTLWSSSSYPLSWFCLVAAAPLVNWKFIHVSFSHENDALAVKQY